MEKEIINGRDFADMISSGFQNLACDYERINDLNVFPVPDGDTGSNMKMTIEGGAKAAINISTDHIGDVSKLVARGMILSARGNSGVILSQFFKGLSLALEGKNEINVKEFSEAMIAGTKKAYSVVANPTEGTILTVMREAGENTIKRYQSGESLVDYLNIYLEEANESLKRTPELLPILKKAGVIDSGGAGFTLIIEGILKSLKGEKIEEADFSTNTQPIEINFGADSELTYGYCTEFILQLQNSKVNVKTFDLNIILDFLNSIGNSIVAFKDEDLVKVHVHTFDPGKVLTECRKYGEFITIKIENMNVEHHEKELTNEENILQEKKKYAVVAVSSGEGITKALKEMGVDVVVSGGQTMNTSTEDFIKAFDTISAENILVFPNNSNIKLAAKQAADMYDKANVYVIPTKTIVEGYSAISMLNFDLNANDLIAQELDVISNVHTLEVTYAIRDCELNDVKANKNDFICLYEHEMLSSNKDRLKALEEAFNKIPNFIDAGVMTIIYGSDTNLDEVQDLINIATKINPYIEAYSVDGGQDIYSYIIGVE